jgi:hypothetical protein
MASDKLYKLREGIPPHKNVTIRGENFSVVILPTDTMRLIEEQTEEYCQKNKDKANDAVRQTYYDRLIAYHSLRDPDDITLSTKVAEKPEDIGSILDQADVGIITNAYGELLLNKAPKIELLTQEELDIIKKHLEATPLSDLSTVLLVHLSNCHQAIVSEI